ncbi:MAG TPA: hypothetical protein VF339_08065 [Gammaproteobacteria bacterium]
MHKQPGLPISHGTMMVGLLAAASVCADPVEVPYEFTAGSTARASEVNANFEALATAINENDNRTTAALDELSAALQTAGVLVVDGNDAPVGLLLNIDDDKVEVDVLTSQDYIVDSLSLATGEIGGTYPHVLLFPNQTCSGQPYVAVPAGFVFAAFDLAGTVGLYFVDKSSAAALNVEIGSSSSGAGCEVSQLAPFWAPLWPALPNDPSTTGVASRSYQLPVTIRRSR